MTDIIVSRLTGGLGNQLFQYAAACGIAHESGGIPVLDATHFAWIGPCDDASPFYYRVLSPVILIEFDHVSGIVYDNDAPSRDHIHTVVRTPNGNDYGLDLLRLHYEQSPHHQKA